MDINAGVRNSSQLAPAAPAKPAKKKKFGKKGVLITIVVLLLAGVSGFLYWQNAKAQQKLKKLSNPTEAAKAETDSLVKEVGKVVELPSGETPTIATVADASKLKSQSFFANAQNGDKVLIYTNAKKAFLYRPSTKKLIEVAPINLGNNTTTAPSSSTTKP